ncbi:hypothetical protein D047_1376A, partial [Vibrio parahaemolyticus VPTS-2010_2]
MSFNIALSGLN